MKLWLDVDDLFYFAERSARPTGIQRLTGEVYVALMDRDPDRVGFVRHSEHPGLFKVVEWPDVRATYQQMTGAAKPSQSRQATPIEEAPPPAKPSSPMARLINRLVSRRMEAPSEPSPIAPKATDLHDVASPDDVLCSLGAPWHDSCYAERVSQITRMTGMRFAVLVHDLIPLVRPEFFEAGRAPSFGQVIRGTLPLANTIFTNSRATALDVSKWAALQGITLRSQPRHVPIGTGFTRPPAGLLPEQLEPGEYVLFVSTIEVRKNHLQAFRVWCRMLQEMPRDQVPTLVFAGGWGWMVEDLKKAIESSNWLNGKLVIIATPDDATLAALYRGCRFTLFPSHYEGWGLPVSDSLAFGKVCIASDRTSMPEAGGDFCVYVDPDNTTAAYKTIRRLIEHPDELAKIEMKLRSEFSPVGWSATADAILEATLPAAHRSADPSASRPFSQRTEHVLRA
jgi:glycosyltransferase involved in cell wall biosynthesis